MCVLTTNRNALEAQNATKYAGFLFGFVNLFHAIAPFLYPLKTSENETFSDIFRGCTIETA